MSFFMILYMICSVDSDNRIFTINLRHKIKAIQTIQAHQLKVCPNSQVNLPHLTLKQQLDPTILTSERVLSLYSPSLGTRSRIALMHGSAPSYPCVEHGAVHCHHGVRYYTCTPQVHYSERALWLRRSGGSTDQCIVYGRNCANGSR